MIVRPGTGARRRREDRLGPHFVPAAEWARPDERAGSLLLKGPTALTLEEVVVPAERCQVRGDSGAAVLVLDRVVLVATSGTSAAADSDAGPIADLGVATQACTG